MGGLGNLVSIANIAMMAYSAYQMNQQYKDQADELKPMENVNLAMNGGDKGEVSDSVTDDGKTDNRANFLKSADSKTKKKSTGLGFSGGGLFS